MWAGEGRRYPRFEGIEGRGNRTRKANCGQRQRIGVFALFRSSADSAISVDWLDDTLPNRERRGASAGFDPQLGEDVRHVRGNRARADEQNIGDLSIG